MSDIVKISCPSCGSKLSPSDNINHFACESCGNVYIFKQTGDSISLLPVATSNPNIVGNNNVVVRISNVIPTMPTASEQISQSNKSVLPIVENGECPICGKLVSQTDTFRCKNCQRSFICLSHQNKHFYMCSECVNLLSEKRRASTNDNVSKYLGIISLVVSCVAVIFACMFLYHAIRTNYYQSKIDYYNEQLRSSQNLTPSVEDTYTKLRKDACSTAQESFIAALDPQMFSFWLGSLSLVIGVLSVILHKRFSGKLGIALSLIVGAILLVAELTLNYSHLSCI